MFENVRKLRASLSQLTHFLFFICEISIHSMVNIRNKSFKNIYANFLTIYSF